MEKLKTMSVEELQNKYFDEFGVYPANCRRKILAALYFGKSVQYLTEEEINEANQD